MVPNLNFYVSPKFHSSLIKIAAFENFILFSYFLFQLISQVSKRLTLSSLHVFILILFIQFNLIFFPGWKKVTAKLQSLMLQTQPENVANICTNELCLKKAITLFPALKLINQVFSTNQSEFCFLIDVGLVKKFIEIGNY